MKTFRTTALVLIAFNLLTGCDPNDPAPPPLPSCTTANSDFTQLFAATLASNSVFDDYTNMDLLTHEYTFSVATNETVCAVGYQGNAVLFANNIPYTVEIFDNTNNALVYSGSHFFDSAFTDYQSVIPTNLVAGNTYTIRRIVTNYMGNIGTTTGRILRFNGSNPYPVTTNGLTITASDFYGTGGPVTNYGIPYIDIIFQ